MNSALAHARAEVERHGVRRGRDRTIRADAQFAEKLVAIRPPEQRRDLRRTGFLQRKDDRFPRGAQLDHGLARGFQILPHEQQHVFYVAGNILVAPVKRPARARGEGVKIDRRVQGIIRRSRPVGEELLRDRDPSD